jgi:hypothetical protein
MRRRLALLAATVAGMSVLGALLSMAAQAYVYHG